MKLLLLLKIIICSSIGILILLFLFYQPVNLYNFEKRIIAFNLLPVNVQKVYNAKFENETSGQWAGYTCISLDEAYNIKHEHTGMDDGLLILFFKGFNHHFYINEKHYILQANKGHPFILFDKKFYYPKNLNLHKANFKTQEYVEIDLSKELTN